MKYAIIIVLALTSTCAYSQYHFFGVKGGINWTNVSVSNIDFMSSRENSVGFNTGITYEYMSGKHLTAGAALNYNQRGFTNDTEITDAQAKPTGKKVRLTFDYNYVSLPLKIGVVAGNRLYGIGNIGLVPSWLVSAKTTTPIFDTANEPVGTETFDITDRVSKFDVAGLIEVGYGFKITNRLRTTTSIIYQRSITSITNTQYFSDSKIRHNGASLNIGLQYAWM